MARIQRALTTLPFIPLAGAAFIASQVLRAAHRSDLPSLPNQDVTGTFGEPSLPAVKVVALGDSSLTAPGVPNLDDVWIRRLARQHEDRFHIELISLAVGGSKALDVIEGQLDEAIRLEPDIAIVSVGGNDAVRGVPVRRYERRLRHIVGRLHGASRAVIVIGMGDLGSIPRLPPALRPYLTRRSKQFNAAARVVALDFPNAVKVWSRGRMTSAFWEDTSLFAADQFHASAAGHAVFAEATEPFFAAALELAAR